MRFPTQVAQALRPLVLLAFVLTLSTGCRSLESPPASAANPATDIRNNAASLLYQVLGDEKDVNKLLIIKRDRPELRDVIREISASADAARQRLEKLAQSDRTLSLNTPALPPGEKAARESISKARAKELLKASGADFEFKLLLTQVEALSYAEHLATVAAESESSPERAQVFTRVGSEANALREKAISLLRPPRN